MSDLDYEVSQVHAKGSVLPWLLLTVVVAMAAVGMVSFNTAKQQAMHNMDGYKQQVDELKKRQGPLEQQVEDANRQLAALKAQADDATQKLDAANKQISELTEQLKLTKAEGSSRGRHRRSRRRRR